MPLKTFPGLFAIEKVWVKLMCSDKNGQSNLKLVYTPLTPPKFNMEPENDGFQEELPFLGTSFQVPC